MRALSCGLLLTASLGAQIARGDWVVSTFNDFINNSATGGLWQVDAARTTATLLANQTANMPGANAVAADENGLVFYGTIRTASIAIPNPCEIFQVVIAAGAVVAETPLTTGPIDAGSVSALALRHDQIWFVTDAGNVGWIPRTGGAPTFVLNLQAQGVHGLGQSIATNGREIFVGTSHTTSTPDVANVWSIDPENPAPALTPLAFLGGSAFALDLARDGLVLAGRVSGRLYLIDPLVSNQTPNWINSTAPAPQANSNGLAIDPWLNLAGNVAGFGTTARTVDFYDVSAGTWAAPGLPLNTSVPSGVATAHEEPFFLFGRGCPGANGQEPRIGWNGMPLQGQSFNLTLRDGDASPGIAFLFVGLSDTVGPFGPLPADLGFVGAPGCSELISLEASSFTLLSNGAASVSNGVPVNPALAGFRFFAQWAVGSSANPFGFVVSDGVAIQVR